MNNVVNFINKDVAYINKIAYPIPKSNRDYLNIAKRALTKEDYEDILLSIMDVDYYNELEQPLKDIVDIYSNGFKQ